MRKLRRRLSSNEPIFFFPWPANAPPSVLCLLGGQATLSLTRYPSDESLPTRQRGIGVEFDVTIEIPKGPRNKYEVDPVTGRVKLDRYLYTAFGYPADYGFIENTLRSKESRVGQE